MTDPRNGPVSDGREKYQESPQHAQRGYETLDASPGATLRAGLYILGAMFFAALVAIPAFRLMAREEGRSQPPARTVVSRQPAETLAPVFPRLVVSEPAVLADFRRQEDELLNGYGWVEKDRGIARMPVSEAMRIVGERGVLPTFPAPAAGAAATAPRGGR